MKNITHRLVPVCLLLVLVSRTAFAQSVSTCVNDNFTGEVFINYGSVSNAFSAQQRTNLTVGQPVVSTHFGQNFNGAFGFWSRYLLPPAAPSVQASEGELEDRVQIDWSPDPLSPTATGGFKIYRNGALLASTDSETFSFIDFNVIAGKFYTYEVSGVNEYGEGGRGSALGFLNPNGVVTGQVKSFSNNPVPGAVITLLPTLGAALSFDGVDDFAFSDYNDTIPRSQFTLSCWVKLGDGNDNAAILDFGSHLGKNWWLHTLPGGQKGVRFGVGRSVGDVTQLDCVFPASTAAGWHFVAATFNGSALLLYLDGELMETAVTTLQPANSPVFFGKKLPPSGVGGTGYFKGKLDEVRFFKRQLSQTELQTFMSRSVPANMNGLSFNWKFDEAIGGKAFDQSASRQRIHFCGAAWTNDKPVIVNAGVTNEAGFYEISGVNYGAGQTFTATPSKSFYFNQSLEFNAANQTHADLTDFPLPDTATLMLTLKPFNFTTNQAFLTKLDAAGNNLLSIWSPVSGSVALTFGGQTQYGFTTLGMGFNHLTFTFKKVGGVVNVDFYKNGVFETSRTFNAVQNWSGFPWKLGAIGHAGSSLSGFFTGLIDEVAVFDKALSPVEIQDYANNGTDASNAHLENYFNLNEGEGATLHDIGKSLTGEGSTHGTTWSSVAAVTQELAHEFTPSSRLVTLNPSSTAVDQVDFTDMSTIPVSGFVRFEGTSCFQEKVEILVNGFSTVPQTFTNAEGKFILDLEPGMDVKLSPKMEGHSFSPPFWELFDVSAPVSGILFRNQTTRKVQGQVAGNEACRKSIIPPGAMVKVKIATLDGCFEQVKILPEDGNFIFENVPPDSVTVAVTEHSNPVIFNYFQNKGGFTLDLKSQNDTVDFIYLAPPQVEVSALDTNACGDPTYSMLQQAQVTIKVYEEYHGGRCYLDTALLTINNDIAHLNQFDTLMTAGSFVHKFRVEEPNIVPPHLKNLQVTAKAHDELTTEILSAVVLGRKPRQTTFTSTAPEFPTLILRDPPGDGSSSYLEAGETTCKTWGFSATSATDIERHVTVSLGPDIETEAGTPFFATSLQVDVTADIGMHFQSSTIAYSASEMETCVTTSKRIATDDKDLKDLVVGSGMGGDLYVGGAMNYLFGITDELLWDTANCSFYLDKGLYVFPKGFQTTFLYTEYHILNTLIPNLLLINDTISAKRWKAIVDSNTVLKNRAVFSKNLSFDAGVVYEESETTEASQAVTQEWTQTFNGGFALEFGVTVNGIGLVGGLDITFHSDKSRNAGSSTASNRTVGYSLGDDDVGDNFTVNVMKDRAFGTPVFKLISGRSSCPYEPGTQPRHNVALATDKQVAINVPMNDVAVFKLTLGNTSQSEETQVYELQAMQEFNPHGAVIRFNGLTSLSVEVPFGEPVVVTMTVARGPLAFNYENLRVAFFSACEGDRADLLGIDPHPWFNQELDFDVYFLEPCSEVDISFPQQDWVLVPANGNVLNVTTTFYDVSDPDLELVRVQYRRSQGDGAWINIAEILKADLGAVFTIVPWNTQGLQDGNYEIRAVTQCFSGALNPGISHVVKGKIERTPPEIIGTPQPADGVLSPNDEISITFSEPIRCDQLIQADLFSNNNVGLYQTATGDLVDAVVTCSGDKITIVPNVPTQFIENQVLRVEIGSVRDLANNYFDHAQWEFYVDKNSLRWRGANIEESVVEGNAVTVTREIENVSGTAVNYSISSVPEWVSVLPDNGSLSPGATQVVTFKFSETLPQGDYLDSIFLETPLGDEPLTLDFRVLCQSPQWLVDPTLFDYTMNFTVELDIEGELSVDEMDVVAAFVGNSLRGVAHVQYEPAVDKWLAFLTVYSNQVAGETIEFQIWDAAQCLLFGDILESYPFVLDGLVGSPLAPQTLHTNGLLLRNIPVHAGWNWLSFNLNVPDKSTGNVLSSLSHPENGLVKSQTQFSQYHSGSSSWLGTLANLGYKSMYQLKAGAQDTIRLVGLRMDADTVQIPISAGWNWLPFLPNKPMHPDDALASLTPLNGDIVKGQTSFAQYVVGQGWIGNLDLMSAPNGYLLKISNPGVLTFPAGFAGGGGGGEATYRIPSRYPIRERERERGLGEATYRIPSRYPIRERERGLGEATYRIPSRYPIRERERGLGLWTVDPSQFEHSMNLIAVVGEDNLLAEGDVVGAFSGDEVRGGNEAIWIEPMQKWLVFLTVYANGEGEEMTFKYYDASAEDIFRLNEKLPFQIDQLTGTVEAPQVLTLLESTGTEEVAGGGWLEIYPNPASEFVFAAFGSTGNETAVVRISDSFGRVVERLEVQAVGGLNVVKWDAGRVANGTYFITLTAGGQAFTRRFSVLN